MPEKVQYFLMNRSIFDVLCDILFLQTITNFIKLILAPVIYNLDPKGLFYWFKISTIT
jgi:hypothetical protein